MITLFIIAIFGLIVAAMALICCFLKQARIIEVEGQLDEAKSLLSRANWNLKQGDRARVLQVDIDAFMDEK